MLVGALAGTVVGGALIDVSAAAVFVLWAMLLPLLALPTLAWQRTSAPIRAAEPAAPQGSAGGCCSRCCTATAPGRC